ncbi:hypothetical protein B0I37DRAFT_91469 [Chaetomium sp. MPI-CAGE-AT-0009]|nr:hypothetical protein B0I37DRAFT_91469 [Chaetomium sp. MPI-CAGE-AT-0009]
MLVTRSLAERGVSGCGVRRGVTRVIRDDSGRTHIVKWCCSYSVLVVKVMWLKMYVKPGPRDWVIRTPETSCFNSKHGMTLEVMTFLSDGLKAFAPVRVRSTVLPSRGSRSIITATNSAGAFLWGCQWVTPSVRGMGKEESCSCSPSPPPTEKFDHLHHPDTQRTPGAQKEKLERSYPGSNRGRRNIREIRIRSDDHYTIQPSIAWWFRGSEVGLVRRECSVGRCKPATDQLHVRSCLKNVEDASGGSEVLVSKLAIVAVRGNPRQELPMETAGCVKKLSNGQKTGRNHFRPKATSPITTTVTCTQIFLEK